MSGPGRSSAAKQARPPDTTALSLAAYLMGRWDREDRDREFLAAALEGMWAFDAESRTTYAGSRVANLLGYSPEEMLGMSLFDFMDAEGKAIFDSNVERRRQNLPEQHDIKLLHLQGRTVWVVMQTSERLDPRGKVEGTLATVTDITARKQAEQATLSCNAELRALNQWSQALNTAREPGELFELMDLLIGQILDNRNLYIALYDETKRSLSYPVYRVARQRIKRASCSLANGLTEYVIRTRAPLWLSRDAAHAARAFGIEPRGEQGRCYLGVPIFAGAGIIGVIAVRDFECEEVYNQGHFELLMTVASQASAALENARRFKAMALMARTDALTGVSNRRHLFEAGARELLRAQRFGHPLSALMLDIDQFKQVNDTHGHATGDRILKTVAQCLRKAMRDIDIVARYGGEEFVILLVETDLPGARTVAERMLEQVSKAVAAAYDGPLRVTVSLGLSGALVDSDGLDMLLVRADGALYAAKEAGGNQVVVV